MVYETENKSSYVGWEGTILDFFMVSNFFLPSFSTANKHIFCFVFFAQRQVAEQARFVLESIHDNSHIKENLKGVIEFQRKLHAIVDEVRITFCIIP